MKRAKEIYRSIKRLSSADIKNFLRPHRTEAIIYGVEVLYLSAPMYLIGKCIVFENDVLAAAATVLPVVPQALTYAAPRVRKLYGSLFEKETPLLVDCLLEYKSLLC